jgi:hypothetical protein
MPIVYITSIKVLSIEQMGKLKTIIGLQSISKGLVTLSIVEAVWSWHTPIDEG